MAKQHWHSESLMHRWRTNNGPWLAWAYRLTERYRHFTEQSGALDLVLARVPLAHLVRQRCLVLAQRICQQFMLAIHPILHQSDWRRQPLLMPPSRTAFKTVRESQRSVVNRIFGRDVARNTSSTSTAVGLTDRTRPIQDLPTAFYRTQPFTIARANFGPGSPSQLVFQMLVHPGKVVRFQNEEHIHMQRSIITTKTNNRELIQRIARLSKRVEEGVAKSTTLLTIRPPTIEMVPAMTTRNDQIVGKEVGQAWQHHTAPATAIDLSQITDQVMRQLDRRVVATRERLGRI
jgi:hypothetical protein